MNACGIYVKAYMHACTCTMVWILHAKTQLDIHVYFGTGNNILLRLGEWAWTKREKCSTRACAHA
jgi:hypothetical protein